MHSVGEPNPEELAKLYTKVTPRKQPPIVPAANAINQATTRNDAPPVTFRASTTPPDVAERVKAAKTPPESPDSALGKDAPELKGFYLPKSYVAEWSDTQYKAAIELLVKENTRGGG